MWERFSFYGMKALLIAYMVTPLKFDEPKAYAILGSYAALVYTMPMFGGVMADRFAFKLLPSSLATCSSVARATRPRANCSMRPRRCWRDSKGSLHSNSEATENDVAFVKKA